MAGRIDELPDPFANPLDSLPDPFAADYKKPGVVLPAAKRLGGRLVQSTGQALEDLGVESAAGITQRGRNIQERNPAYVQSLAELVDRPAQFVGETLADGGAQVGTSALGAKVGGIAGGLIGGRLGGAPGAKAGAKIGATFGGSAPLALQPYGGMRDSQAEQGVDDPGRAVAASAASAAVERLGLEKLAGKLVGGEVAKLARDDSRYKEIGKSALRGGLVEPPTEGIQTGIERLGGYRPLWDEEALDEYGVAMLGGLVSGAGIGGGLGALTPREQAAPGSEFSQGPQAGGPPGTTPQQSGPAGALPPPTYTGSPGDPAAEYEAQRVAMENRERAEGLYSERAAEEARRQAAIDALAPQPGPQPPLALPAPELADNGVMAVGPDGVARPQYQGEAEQAAATRQQRSIDMGLTPDVVAAQQRRQSQAQDLATLAQQPNAGPLTKAVGNNIDGTSLGQQAPRLTGPGALEGELLAPEKREAPKTVAPRDQDLIDPENYQKAMGLPMRPDVAQRVAEGLSAKGVESEVLPHPNKPGMLMVVPKNARTPAKPERDITPETRRVEVDPSQETQASDGGRGNQALGGARDLQTDEGRAAGRGGDDARGLAPGLRAPVAVGDAEPQPKPSLSDYDRVMRRAKETPVSLTNQDQQVNPADAIQPEQAANAAERPAVPEEVAAASPTGQASTTPAADAAPASAGEPIVEHVTKKGKTLRGVVRRGITLNEAKAIDPYAFKKDGGIFIREDRIAVANMAAPEADAQPATEQAPASPVKSSPGYLEDGPSVPDAKFKPGETVTARPGRTIDEAKVVRVFDREVAGMKTRVAVIERPDGKRLQVNEGELSAGRFGSPAAGETSGKQAQPAGARRPQPGESGYTLVDAMNDLMELRAQAESQGRVADARLMSSIRQQEKLVRDMEAGTSDGALSDDELSTLFDEAAAELREQNQEQPDVPPPGERVVGDKPPPGGWTEADKVPKAPPKTASKPDPKVDQTAAKLVAEAARQGVKGIDEALTGLTKLFGGNNTLRSFPGGIDPDTYAQAKPHFEAALKAFIDAGKTIKDLFKFLIQNFGEGVKPYAIQFAREKGLGANLAESPKQAENQPQEGADNVPDGQTTARDDRAGDDGEGARAASATDRQQDAGQPDQPAGGSRERVVSGGAVDGAEGRGDGAATASADGADAGSDGPAAGGRRGSRGPSGRVPERKRDGNNFLAPQGSLKREGSWRATAERNLDIVELVQRLEAEGRQATPEEQAKIAKFTGWGASEIAQNLFPRNDSWAKPEWKALVERRAKLMSDAERDAAARSTQYAHYTSEEVIRGIWTALDGMGFKGGTLLEPGMGVGLFAAAAPKDTMERSRYTGIEYDPFTAKIAKQLFQRENVIEGDYTKTKLPRDFFDAAIGNPPFGKIVISNDPEYAKQRFVLHDYFFAKTMDRVRPGGLVVFVTSRYTMDKAGSKARKYLADQADLLGAIRLPQTAFKDNAGTEVVTDILFLRKRLPGEAPNGVQWTGAATVDMDAGPLNPTVNEYFAANPDMVLGTPALEGSMYRSKEYTVLPPEGSIETALKKAINKLPKGVYTPKNDARAMVRESIERDFNPKTKKEGTLYISDKGDLMRVESGSGVGLAGQLDKPLSAKDAAWVKDYVGLRDAVKQAQYDQLTDGEWETSLKALNKNYDAFVKKHGNVRAFTKIERTETDEDTGETKSISYYRWKNAKLLFLDVESPVVEMLESISEDDSIEKAAFLKARTIKKPTRREINGTNDALLVSLDERGGLDIPFVAELAKKDEAAVIKELGNQIYEVPGGSWSLADEYLSGDVVTKLEEAEAAAEIDDKYQRNVQALLKVQPKPLAPADITVQIGAGWIPVETYEDFASDVLGAEVSITHIPQTNTWKIEGGMSRGAARQQISDFGTPDRSALEILETALLGKDVKITRKDGDGKSYTDKDATAAVNEKLKAMKETFGRWVWQDAGRGARLAALYNRTFNNLAPRTFDGSHLSLPGLSLKYKLYDHQKRAIWRIVQTGNTYLDHAVGAGKTLEMIVAGMEMRRLGLVSKPMYVVPKHMLKQFASEFLDAYPAANILVADDKNFDKANRGRFVAQAALNDPDAVIVTHPSFTKLSVKDESLQRVSGRFVGDLKMAIDEEGDRFRRKEMEAQLERLERRFAAKAGKEGKDAVVDFEDLGVDFIFVDEAHEFRKLDFISRRGNIKGIDSSGSARALDLFVKIQHLDSLRPGRSAVLASGTPVVNTIAELYSIMRMLDIRSLEKDGLDHFDVWANQFGDVRRELEQNAAGQYEFVERFAQFVNVPELMKRVRNTMDVLTSTQLGALVKRPDLEGGQPDLIINPISDRLDNYLKNELAARIEASRNWKPSPGEPNNKDPLINIISDGRLAAIDMRFVDKSLKDDPDSKLNRMLEDIVARHREIDKREYTDKETGGKDMVRGGTQIVFSSVGFGAQVAASRGFDVKAEIVKKLTAGGIRRDQIAFMDEHSTDAKKAQLFKDMRSGKVRVLFGSPKNMGTGVNVQKRLSFLHYLSPPWYPADVEQPHGRILRQGNQNPMVGIKWYATKGTYDSTMWQMVSRKQKFIEQAFTGDDSVRKLEDVSESSQYEMASALSSGDQRAIQLAGLNADIERLTRLQNAHADEQATFRGRKRSEEFMLKQARERLKQVQDANDAMGGEYVSDMTVNIDGQALKESVAAGEAIRAAMTKVLKDWKPAADSASEANKNAPSVEIARIQGKYPLMVDAEMISTGDGAVKTGNLTLVLPNNIEQEIEQNNRNPENLDPRGLYTRVRNRLNSLPSMLADQKSRVAELESNIEKVTARIGVPFQFEADLFDKVKEAADLRAALAGETDAKKAESEAAPDLRADDGRRVADGFTAKQAREIIRRRFGKGAENLEREGILKLISSPADYPPKYAAYLNKMAASRNIKGFYDPESGSAFVIPGNIKSEDDLVKTVLHEIGEHYGLKTMMGDSAYARLLKQLSAMKATNPRVREAFEKVGRLYQHLEPGSERFLREVLASASEDPSILSQPWYKQLIQAIRRFLFKTGIVPIRFTDAELAGMVAASLRQSMRLPPGGPRGGRREPTMERRGEDGIDFRLDDPAGTINRISAAAQKLPSASDFNADKRSTWLKALTRQQIVDVGKEQFNTASGNLAQQFERIARQIEADSNNELNKPIGKGRRTFGEIAEAWAKMASPNPLGGNRAGAAQLARLMHDATLAGLDPDLKMPEGADPAEYARLRKAFTALPADVQTLYRDVRDAYAKRREDFEQALTQRIEESKASGSQKRAMLNSLRQQFEAGRVKGPYFPLARFGDYYVVAEKDGQREFVMAESQAEQRRESERLRAEGFTVRAGKSIKGLASEMGKGNSTFIADMVDMIDQEVPGPEADALKDGLWQMYLQSLPELSVRKKFIHRKGTPGFSQDALRAFASQIGHGSKQIARLRHAHKLSDALRAMKEHAPDAPDPNKAADILKALDSSYQWMMNPNNASWANNLTNLGFAWYLGVTPAAAAVNLTQLPIVTLPVLAAKNGWAAASSALGAALKDYTGSRFNKAARAKLEGERGGDLGRMLKELEDSGAISRTMSMSLMGLSDANSAAAIGSQRVMKLIGGLFHGAEVMNREVTAIAAYRLARNAGKSHEDATQSAYDAIFESHFDYSSENRAEFMRGNVARVILLFKQYSQNMSYFLARNFHQTFKGASKEERREAATKLFGVVGMTGAFAGTMGLPLVGMTMTLAGLLEGLLGDDDEPWDVEAAYRMWLDEQFGAAGDVLAKGVGNLTGADIASRTSLGELWFRRPSRDLEGQAMAQHYIGEILGPVVGIGVDMTVATQLMAEGKLFRGFEKAMPKFARDFMKTYRFADEGATNLRGDPVVEQFSAGELAMQASGLAPAVLNEQYDRTGAMKRIEQRIMKRRQSLMTLYVEAANAGDEETMREAIAKIARYNKAQPSWPITSDSLRQSIRSRANYSERMIGGVGINPKLREQVVQQVWQ